MAAVHAGVKRTHHQMYDTRSPLSGRTSREQSPLKTTSPAPSRPLRWQQAEGKFSSVQSPPRKSSFKPSSSIALIGVRGVGKSSLGILAAAAYDRQIVDSERAFVESTGQTATNYRRLNGTQEYRRRHHQVLENTLSTHESGCVIVCNFSDLENNGAALLQAYAQSHPVIHVTRDASGIQSHLQVWTEERINELLTVSDSLLRSCSNYEFFNLSEEPNDVPKSRPGEESQKRQQSFLTLKRVERDFVRLLRNIIGDDRRGLSHHSAYPLSQRGVEERPYTFAVTVNVSEVLSGDFDLDTVQVGSDCIELVVDANYPDGSSTLKSAARAFAAVRRGSILPIMLRVGHDRGMAQADQATSVEITDYCLRLAPEICAVALNLDQSHLIRLTSNKGHSRLVGIAEFEERPAAGWNDRSCIETYLRAAELGCDFAKITMPADSIDDAFAVHAFQKDVGRLKKPCRLITYNTGAAGRISKCFNKTLTTVRPAEVLKDQDGSLTARSITQARFSMFIHEPMRFFIYGANVSYSLSPAMHNAAYEACGMPHKYGTHSSDNLEDFRELVRALDFGGIAITQPFKTAAVPMLDGLSPHAEAIGAVNTILPVRELSTDGRMPDELGIISQRNRQGPVKALYGYNTDWIGIRACIRRGLSPANTVRAQSSGLVCGAGGMARSAIYSMISLGVRNIFICNRTLENAKALADHYNKLLEAGKISDQNPGTDVQTRILVIESFASTWPMGARQPTMIVCCIPTQTVDDVPIDFLIPEAWLGSPNGGVVVEVAYRRLMSPVKSQIRERAQRGWICMDGIDVLPEQAFSQFELFTGRRAPQKLMRDEVLKNYRAAGS